jgi:glycosyltransferase involved in cell wall biosynthesis
MQPVPLPDDATAVSLVFPIFNEEAVLPTLMARLDGIIPTLERDAGGAVEVIFVNDGSRDGSMALLAELARTRPWARILSFSRNFGHQIAVTAGMENTRGQAVIIMDADLQDPPELLPEMLRLWREGWEVVYAVRTERAGESAFKKLTAAMFYRMLRRLTNVDIPADTGDFRLMDRKVVDAMNRMKEHHRFLRGMAAWVGYRQIGLPYKRDARAAGETKYPLRKMLRLAMDAVCSFSHAPLRLATNLGTAIAALSILYGVITIVRYFVSGPSFQPGWASLIVVLSFLSGVQLITLGLVGEYIARIYDEVKGRPLYLVAERVGFKEGSEEA